MDEYSSDLTEGFDELLKINPYDVNLLNMKGEALLYECYYLDSMECFNKALSIDPNSSKFLINKGRVFLETGEYKKANNYFDKALLIDPTNGFAKLYKGNSFYFIKNYEEAIKYYNEALVLEPIGEVSTIHYEMGKAYYELDAYEKSIDNFDIALSIEFEKSKYGSNNNVNICSLLREKARSLLFLKKYDDALECSKTMLKLQPENTDALKIEDICLRKMSKSSISIDKNY